MFKFVTECSQQPDGAPEFWLMCDWPTCGAVMLNRVEVVRHEQFADEQKKFIEIAVRQGWQIGLTGQHCDFHKRELVEDAVARDERRKKKLEQMRLDAEARDAAIRVATPQKNGRSADNLVTIDGTS